MDSDSNQGERRPTNRVHPSVRRALANAGAQLGVPVRTKGSFKSLDRSLKGFLRTSNLPGLEYRLRVAGFNSLDDLAEADESLLCSHGFTPLMSRRLLQALEDYVMKQYYKLEEKQLPFQLVRKGQKIDSTPTEKMKELPTYGRRNVKRQKVPDKKSTKTTKNSKKAESANKLKPLKRPVSVVRLMSEDTIPTEPVFPNVSVLQEAEFEVFGTEDDRADEEASAAARVHSPSAAAAAFSAGGVEHSPLIQQHSPTVLPPSDDSLALSMPSVDSRVSQFFHEFRFPDMVDSGFEGETSGGMVMRNRLRRCQSIPADYRYFANDRELARQQYERDGLVKLIRSFSCPSSLTPSVSRVERLLEGLRGNDDIGTLLDLLHQLLRLLKSAGSGEAVGQEVVRGGGVEVLLEVLGSLCTHLAAAETVLKILKHLTRQGDVVPVQGMGVVMDAMDCHPSSKVVLTQACLVLGNIGRAGSVECAMQLMSDRSLTAASDALSRFPSSISLVVSAMAMLGVGLGRCTPDDRLRLISDHGKILDLVVLAMSNHPDHAQLLCYACCFIALLIAEVSVCVESGVMELLVASVCQAANCCSASANPSGEELCNHGNTAAGEDCNVGLMVWVCKALANSAGNAALCEDSKLAMRCCDVLLEGLSQFPDQVQVWLCALYAILQIATNNKSVQGYLARSNLLSLLKSPPRFIPEEGEGYIEQLHFRLTSV